MKGFFGGVLFAAPLTALIMWFVMGYMGTIDTKVERNTVASKLDAAEFNQDFDKRWGEMGGSSTTCSPEDVKKITELRGRLSELEKQVGQDRKADQGKTKTLDEIVNKKGTAQ